MSGQHCPAHCGGCSCHINPPCTHCVDHGCPVCVDPDCTEHEEEETYPMKYFYYSYLCEAGPGFGLSAQDKKVDFDLATALSISKHNVIVLSWQEITKQQYDEVVELKDKEQHAARSNDQKTDSTPSAAAEEAEVPLCPEPAS